jgi:hypothetical protein
VGDNPLQKQRHGGIEAQQHIASRSRPKTSQAGILNKEVAEVLSHVRAEGAVGERGHSRAMRGGPTSWSDVGGGSRRILSIQAVVGAQRIRRNATRGIRPQHRELLIFFRHS